MKALPALLAAAGLSLPLVGQKITPEKVIEEYANAMGGAKALARIQTETITGNVVEEATGKSGSYSLILKSPDRFYLEIVMEPAREIEAYNGMSGWEDSTNGTRTLTGDAEKEAEGWGLFWNGRLADAKKDKLIVQVKGTEMVGGKEAYHLQVKLAPGAMPGGVSRYAEPSDRPGSRGPRNSRGSSVRLRRLPASERYAHAFSNRDPQERASLQSFR